MGRFIRFLRRALKPLRDVSGVSLYETTAVIAMTAVVAAVAIPMALDRLEDSKVARAASEVLTLNSAMQKFFEHTGRWPGEAEIRRSGATHCYLQTGIPTDDPTTGTLLPSITGNLGTSERPISAAEFVGRPCDGINKDNVLNINNFLVQKPSAVDYPNWKGPYMEPIASDPWDRAYVINVMPLIFASTVTDPGAGQFATAVGPLGYGWVFSAGPDRLLQTKLTQSQLVGTSDDVGKNMGVRIVQAAGSNSGQ
jgi:hypothetical protein